MQSPRPRPSHRELTGVGGPTYTGMAFAEGRRRRDVEWMTLSWTDQSGQDRNAVQANAANQPTVTTDLGKPGLGSTASMIS